MAVPAYLSLTAAVQGRIEGSVHQRGREGKIFVIGAFHQIVAPRHPGSGAPTGKRVHKPFIVIKIVDRSTPALYQAMTTNENLPFWELQFYRPNADGTEKNYFTVTLEDATISTMRFRLPNTRDRRLTRLDPYEEVHFTYRRITWLNLDANTTASDDWEAPRS